MKDKFESLPDEKRLLIINAAYKVFSANGYKKASTNEIIQEAGISKGLLFHYFSTKLGLFTYLYQRSLEMMKTQIYDAIDITEPDYLDRLKQVGIIKMRLTAVYPELFDFLTAAYFDKDPAIVKIVATYNESVLNEGYQRLAIGVDFSLFRDDLDLTMILQTINATMIDWSEKYFESHQPSHFKDYDFQSIIQEVDKYYTFFKKSYYKAYMNQ